MRISHYAQLDKLVVNTAGKCFFDYVEGKVVKEEDMRSSFYYHLRRNIEGIGLEGKIEYYVNHSVELDDTIRFPDLVIHSCIGSVYLEFKLDGTAEGFKKDLDTLKKLEEQNKNFLRGWLVHFSLWNNQEIDIGDSDKIKQIAYPSEEFRKQLEKQTGLEFRYTPINLVFAPRKHWIGSQKSTSALVSQTLERITHLSDMEKFTKTGYIADFEEEIRELIRNSGEDESKIYQHASDASQVWIDYMNAHDILRELYVRELNLDFNRSLYRM